LHTTELEYGSHNMLAAQAINALRACLISCITNSYSVV
jgi:hypothetical protein